MDGESRAEPLPVRDAAPRFAMLIVCPSCASEYALDPARIGPQGRSVRCARCRESWFVAPAAAEAEPGADGPDGPILQGEAKAGRSAPDAGPPAAERHGRGRSSRPGRIGAPGRVGAAFGRLRRLAPVLVLALAAALAAGAVLGRVAVVGALPAAAGLYARVGLPVNLRGLEFREIGAEFAEGAQGSSQGASQGLPQASLVVEGEIVNVAGRPMPVPPVEIVVRERPGAPALYTWTTLAAKDVLGPGETARFRARLVEPPAEGREVAVHFAPSPRRSELAARAP